MPTAKMIQRLFTANLPQRLTNKALFFTPFGCRLGDAGNSAKSVGTAFAPK